MNLRDFERLIRPLRVRLLNMVGIGVLESTDDSKGTQEVQASLLGEDDVRSLERPQQYGFYSRPRKGAEVKALFVGGRRDHGLAIVTEDRVYRIRNLADGEVAIGWDGGPQIVLKANGDIQITPGSGLVSVTGDVVADGISLKTHTHDAGDLTSPSGSVTGSSGGPS